MKLSAAIITAIVGATVTLLTALGLTQKTRMDKARTDIELAELREKVKDEGLKSEVDVQVYIAQAQLEHLIKPLQSELEKYRKRTEALEARLTEMSTEFQAFEREREDLAIALDYIQSLMEWLKKIVPRDQLDQAPSLPMSVAARIQSRAAHSKGSSS